MKQEITVTFLVDEELKTAMDGFAAGARLSRSDVIRLALKKFLYDGNGEIQIVP